MIYEEQKRAGEGRPEPGNPKLEIRDKFEMPRIGTDQRAPNKANLGDWGLEIVDWGFGAAEAGMPNKPNWSGRGRLLRCARNDSRGAELGAGQECETNPIGVSHRQAGACRRHPGVPGVDGRVRQTNPIGPGAPTLRIGDWGFGPAEAPRAKRSQFARSRKIRSSKCRGDLTDPEWAEK